MTYRKVYEWVHGMIIMLNQWLRSANKTPTSRIPEYHLIKVVSSRFITTSSTEYFSWSNAENVDWE